MDSISFLNQYLNFPSIFCSPNKGEYTWLVKKGPMGIENISLKLSNPIFDRNEYQTEYSKSSKRFRQAVSLFYTFGH
jgi:hypothetical protein